MAQRQVGNIFTCIPCVSHRLDLDTQGGESIVDLQHGLSAPFHDGSRFDEPLRKLYLTERDRPHMRLPISDLAWMPLLPFIERKLDTMYHCWQEIARLYHKLDQDQEKPEE